MIYLFFALAFIGTILLLFHITIELNTLEKKMQELTEQIGNHYEAE